MSDGTDALQAAVWARLTAALSPVPVYDDVPEGNPFPYVVIGETDVQDWGSKTGDGSEQTLTLTAYSRERGRNGVRLLARQIYQSLHEADFAVSGQQLVLIRFEQADYAREADGQTYSVRLRYRALLDALSDGGLDEDLTG